MDSSAFGRAYDGIFWGIVIMLVAAFVAGYFVISGIVWVFRHLHISWQ